MIKSLSEIQNIVFSRRPVLKEILADNGTYNLIDYVQNHWRVGSRQPDTKFLEVFEQELTRIYNPDLAKKAKEQLLAKPVVSTIDHLGIWNHPFFVNSSLIYSLYYQPQELAVVLATESISLNNSSWPGALGVHNNKLELERHSFFLDKNKHWPVLSAPSLSASNVERFNKKSFGRLKNVVEILQLQNGNAGESFAAQACRASFNLWQAVFPSAPKLVYAPLETIVAKYLLEVFKDRHNLLSQLVLTKQGRGLWQKYFENESTFMFWGTDSNGIRKEVVELPENEVELFNLIIQKKLYPSSPLCFAVLLYAGLTCAGGFTQTTWLTEIQAKLLKLLGEIGEVSKSDILNMASLSAKNFAESSLAWLKLNGEYIAPTSVDLYFCGQDYYPKYLKFASVLNLNNSFSLALPTIYSVVGTKEEKQNFNYKALQTEIFGHFNTEKALEKADI